MNRPDRLRPLLVALPGLALAGAGLLHPHSLTASSAGRWTFLHVAGLFVFPLVGLALVTLVRARLDPLSWGVRLAAYVYATAYTALDVISGIGAGWVTRELGEGVPRPDEVRHLFAIGGRIGEVGSWALIVCTVLVAADALRRRRSIALPGLALVVGAALVHREHIFAPTGAAGMALIGLATGWLALLERGRPEVRSGSAS
ncbi:hypothetical protein [Nocardioides currus]|uniref:Uncharacterized protein n=1 Tax=Nocardioides currus TaxID=2133958 RepID=A0A2R7YVC3_9ACTN|nr:hypothetical protein [Nocardioides currus]PUA80318.1 hypothetical protein C7S10_14395 [Nocardioides currus]